MKKLFSGLLIAALLLSCIGCTNKGLNKGGDKNKLSEFYDSLTESQELLDTVADAIYDNWYDAIYNDEFAEDINLAIYSAQADHEEDISRIENLDNKISDLFKEVKDYDQSNLIKDVMSAYSDYYEFVINVSGSFESYSENKEILKKEFSGLLRELSYEL